MHTLAVVQAERAGPRGPKASGVKAGWPRFGTKRGAQPANPTAARRDARLFLALLGAKRSVRFDPPPGVLQFLLQHFGIRQHHLVVRSHHLVPIGKPSCRERVCPYVEISGVVASLT